MQLSLDTYADHALDDIDVVTLTSPPRAIAGHRRARSDPSEFLARLRCENSGVVHTPDLLVEGLTADVGEAVSSAAGVGKRELSPPRAATGFSPMVKKQAAASATPLGSGNLAERRAARPPSVSSSAFDDFGDEARLVDFGARFSVGIAPPANADSEAPLAPKQPLSKKDVPMWTVEEDLLILQLVEQHGKRWSKIASHLPGRTDNGVRNRWNRMERAQVIKQNRAPGAGYRCRRCGEPKRGHICAARTTGDRLEGEDLHLKAAALTELSAQAMAVTTTQVPCESEPSHSRNTSVGSSTSAAPSAMSTEVSSRASPSLSPVSSYAAADVAATSDVPRPPPLSDSSISAKIAALAGDLGATALVPPAARPPPVVTPGAPDAATPPVATGCSTRDLAGAEAAAENFDMCANVDEFLEELRKALDDTASPVPPAGAPATADVTTDHAVYNAPSAAGLPPAPASPPTLLNGTPNATGAATASPLFQSDALWRGLESPGGALLSMLAF